MAKADAITVTGKVIEVLPGTMFRVRLDNDHDVLAHVSGKMRQRFVRLVAGDRVSMEMSPYDLDKARIIYRLDPNAIVQPPVPPQPQAQA